MPKKIMLINSDHPEECRAVILEDGKVDELIVEHSSHEQIKGNIYLGVINRVEPAIEAAFLDIGGKKFGFLPFKDVRRDSYIQTGERKAKIRIQDVLVRGQKLLVQVVKEGRDAKGPSLTNWISLPGRFLVLMVGQEASAVSRKIEDESERKKLKEIIADFDLPDNMGVIIRTAGLGRTKAELQKDLQMLMKIWNQLEADVNTENPQAPVLLYREPNMVVRTVRDHFTADTSEIIVDDSESYKEILGFVKMVMPRLHRRVKFYKETKPMFSQYKVEEQIESIYDRNVPLPSGGSIVIDIGEAMVSIDVNSGKTTGASQLEETAVNTNVEAANEIGRQLRLRDLGGLIVIDFIDMYQKKNKALVERELKQVCKKDKARINLARISKFGLLEMSRQRMSPPVKEGVFESCKLCNGTGLVKSVGAVVLGMLRKIQETIAQGKVGLLAVQVSPEVADYMLKHKMQYLMDLQEKHHFIIEFISKPGLAYANFSYNVLERKRDEDIENETKPKERRASPRGESKRSDSLAPEEKLNRRSRRPSPRSEGKRSDAPASEEKLAQNKEETPADKKEGGDKPRERRPGSSPRKRYAKKKTSSSRSSNYRGRNRRVEKTDTNRGDDGKGTEDSSAKPEVNGNIKEASPAPQEPMPKDQSMSEPTPIEHTPTIEKPIPIAVPPSPEKLDSGTEGPPPSFTE